MLFKYGRIERNDKWKVNRRFDYDDIANTIVFGVVRVDPGR